MPTLADIYSAADSFKRRLSDAASNPGASLQQMLGYANDRARAQNESDAAALNEFQQTGKLNGPIQMQNALDTAQGYSPVGMTAIKGLPTDYHAFGPLVNEAYQAYKLNPGKETGERYKMLMEARDNAPLNNPNKIKETYKEPVEQSYKGQHEAPMKDSGKPLHDLTDIYPEDFYSFEAPRLYGHGMDENRDARIIRQIQSLKGRPDRPVTIYRAVPKDVPRGAKINQGDWVTTDREYAIEHGLGALGGNYKIIKQQAKARDLFTNGDSIYEMGYDPQPYTPRSKR